MTITLTPEDLKKFENAVKEHQGRKFVHFTHCLASQASQFGGGIARDDAARAIKQHRDTFTEVYPTISKVLGLD
jgi:hypothetical protein